MTTSGACFSLVPDPVRGGFLHALNHKEGQVYLVQSSWLSDALASSAAQNSMTISMPELLGATAVPLYAPAPAPAPATTSTATSPAVASVSTLAGFCVIADPLIGHLALARSASGILTLTSIHSHVFLLNSKLREAQAAAASHFSRSVSAGRDGYAYGGSEAGRDSLGTVGGDHGYGDGDDMGPESFLSMADQLSAEIRKGLDDCPLLEGTGAASGSASGSGTGTVHDAEINRWATEATKHLEEKVVTGLEQYAYRIIMLLDSLKERYDRQRKDFETAKRRLGEQQARQAELDALVESKLQQLGSKRDKAVKALQAVARQSQNPALQACEVAFEKELGDWMCQAARMEARVKVSLF